MSRKGKAPSGTWFSRELLLSPAYWSLPKTAYPILAVFFLRRDMTKQHECLNKNDISVTYKELEARGMARGSVVNGLDALLGRGFIKIIRQGGAFQKDKTVYGLADEWKFWQPGEAPIHKRTVGKKAGYGALKKYHNRDDE